MGLKENSNNGGGNILVVQRGALCLKSDTPIDGYEKVEGETSDGNPYVKYVKKFGALDGMVTGINWYDTEDQYDTRFQGIKITIEDDTEHFLLDLPYASKAYDAFTRFADNIDFTKTVEFVAYPDRERKDSTVFNAKQDGQIIRQKYTKSNLGDCPPAVENKRTGKWNFDAQREWLLDNLLENIVPKIQGSVTKESSESGTGKGKKTKAAAASEDRWAGVEDPIHND